MEGYNITYSDRHSVRVTSLGPQVTHEFEDSVWIYAVAQSIPRFYQYSLPTEVGRECTTKECYCDRLRAKYVRKL